MKPSISDKPALIIIFSLILFFSSTSVCYLPPSYSQLNINSPQTLSNTPGNSTDPQIALYNNNLYVVWSDDSTGNGDIYFKRSVDNGTTFQSVENLSNSPGNSTDPQIALYNNNLYVVWSDDSTGNGDIYFKRSVDNGTTFESVENLSNSPGNSTDPQIALYNNNLYVVWSDDSTGNGDIYFKRSVDNGTTFDTVNNISENNTGSSSDPQIGTNSNNVYLVWTDTSSNMSEIFYRQSIDGGVKFGGLKEISKTKSINGEFALYPKIVTSGNKVFVAWQDKVLGGNEIFFRASNDGGNKFTGIKNLSRNNTGDSISPVLAANANNTFIAWSDTSPGKSEILLRSSLDNGNTFGGVKNISWNVGSSYDPQLAISGRNLYVLWEDNSQGGLTFDLIFRASSDGGRNFAEKQNIARYLGESSDYGQIITVGNNVFVVWSESPQFSYPPKYEIFIKTSHDNGTTFGDGVNLSNNDGSSVDPNIAISQDKKTVFVVWSDTSNDNSEISLVRLQI